MYIYSICLSVLKSMNPYFRKHVLMTLDSHELFFINSIVIFTLVIFWGLYKYVFEKTMHKSIENYRKLSFTQMGAIFMICILSIISTIFVYEFDKYYNTPLINFIFSKFVSVIALIAVGIFIFKEKYTWKQIFGIILAIVGIYFVTDKE